MPSDLRTESDSLFRLAEPTPQYRASMTDEQWVDLQSVESDQEWLAIVKRDFGVDVELL